MAVDAGRGLVVGPARDKRPKALDESPTVLHERPVLDEPMPGASASQSPSDSAWRFEGPWGDVTRPAPAVPPLPSTPLPSTLPLNCLPLVPLDSPAAAPASGDGLTVIVDGPIALADPDAVAASSRVPSRATRWALAGTGVALGIALLAVVTSGGSSPPPAHLRASDAGAALAPPSTSPPATAPVTSSPPATSPAATAHPATAPAVTAPVVTSPPVTASPAAAPKTTHPPTTEALAPAPATTPAPVSAPSVPAEVASVAQGIIAAINQQSPGSRPVPVTSDNIELLARWMAMEGGLWADNPLNTDLNAGQYKHQFNGNTDTGTPIYPDMQTGEQAAAATLLGNPSYAPIVAQLRSGNASCQAFATAVIRSPWAASHYGHNAGAFCGANPSGALVRPGHRHGAVRVQHRSR